MIAVDGPQLRTGPGVHAWGDALLPRLGAPPRAVVPTTNFPDEFLPCCTDTNRAVRTPATDQVVPLPFPGNPIRGCR